MTRWKKGAVGVLVMLFMLLLSGCGGRDAMAGLADDGRIRVIDGHSYVNVMIQFGFKSDMGDGFYEFYYESDGAAGHIYDMSASVAIQDRQVSVSGEIWSDGATAWSTSGNGWQETGIPLEMDVAGLPGLFGYDPGVEPKRDDRLGHYVMEWDTELSRIGDSGVFSMIGDPDGIDLDGTAKVQLRTSQEDGSFVSIRIEAEAAALCVVFNHAGDDKALVIPDEAKAATAGPAGPSGDPEPSDETNGTEAGTPQEVLDLAETIRAADDSVNLLDVSADHGVDYIYYETNLVNAWYAWAEIGRPADGDVDALFQSRREAMESVLGGGAYEARGNYLTFVQKSDPSTEEGLGDDGDWYMYLLAKGDGFVLNLTIQDWTSKDEAGVMARAEEVAGNTGISWGIE